MKKLLSLILTLCVAAGLTACAFSPDRFFGSIQTPKDYAFDGEDAKLIVHFIDVGQGDSILLESEGAFVLIDAGGKEAGETVTDFIASRGADSLSYVVATHPHADHIGGMAQVLNTVEAENFITVETDQTTKTWLSVLEAVEKNDVNYIDAAPGDTYSFGEASFTVMAPLGSGYSGYNNYSVVTKVMCGDISFLLTGDAEKESEQEMLRYWDDEQLSADVLKCGHHGSSTSTSDAFLSAVSPAFAVISCGENNDYGHPHTETVQKLLRQNITYYRTDEMGTVSVYTDGEGLRFYAEKGAVSDETYIHQESAASSSSALSSAASSYIGNKNSKVFHLPSCGGVKTMSEKNKVMFSSRDEALSAGYTPCSSCNP